MEFKITSKTTLYELQEHCKKQASCSGCSLRRSCGQTCEFSGWLPADWHVLRPKTYKEDLLKKYPNVFISDNGAPDICRDLIYYGAIPDCLRSPKACSECWNEIMEDE